MMLPDTEEQLFGRGLVTKSTSSKDLELETARRVDLAEAIMKQHGVVGKRTSGWRTDQEQIALYAQGRKPLGVVNALRAKAGMRALLENENKYTVTECNGVNKRSPHQDRKAIDYVPIDNKGKPCWPSLKDPRWEEIAKCFEIAGMVSGLRWKKPDAPHHELPIEI